MVTRRPYKDQFGKVLCEAGIVHKLKMKKFRKAGEKGDQMAAQWEEEQKPEEILERRSLEGSSLQLEVMQNVQELVVHERMSHGKGLKGFKEKKKVSGRSVEEVREKPNTAVEEDTEEMRKWRGLSQCEMDLCWKILAERMEEEVLNMYEVEESKKEAFRGGGAPLEWRWVRKSKRYRIRKW